MRYIIRKEGTGYPSAENTYPLLYSNWVYGRNPKYYCRKSGLTNLSSQGVLSNRELKCNCPIQLAQYTFSVPLGSDITFYDARSTKFNLYLFNYGEQENGAPKCYVGVKFTALVRSTQTPTGDEERSFTKVLGGNEEVQSYFENMDKFEMDMPYSENREFDINNYTGFNYLYLQIINPESTSVIWVRATGLFDNDSHSYKITFSVQNATAGQPSVYMNAVAYKLDYSGTDMAATEMLVEDAVAAANRASEEAHRAEELAKSIKDTFDQIDVNGLISI